MTLLDRPHGGSLNSTEFVGDCVIKHYAGPIDRGHQKLIREYAYLRTLPSTAASHFAPVVAYEDRANPRATTLTLARSPLPAVAKAILSNLVTPGRAGEIVTALARVLLDEVYPVASEPCDGPTVYATYHAPRLRAIDALSTLPDLAPFCTARTISVNGRSCPTLRQIAEWLPGYAAEVFSEPRSLVKAHLDAHLDNVLAEVDPTRPVRIILVDPRGEFTGPPHYDWAKTLKSLRAHYHEIHYGFRTFELSEGDGACSVRLAISPAFVPCMRAGLDALVDTVPAFATAEGVSTATFIKSVLLAELVHVISFAWYHAHRPDGRDTERVLAFLSVASLLAERLMRDMTDLASVHEPLPLLLEG